MSPHPDGDCHHPPENDTKLLSSSSSAPPSSRVSLSPPSPPPYASSSSLRHRKHNNNNIKHNINHNREDLGTLKDHNPHGNYDDDHHHHQFNQQRYIAELAILRIRNEIRQIGGCMFVLGIGAAVSTMALTCQLIQGMTGRNQVEGFLLPMFVAAMIQLSCGLVSMVCGFIALVMAPYNNNNSTTTTTTPTPRMNNNDTTEHENDKNDSQSQNNTPEHSQNDTTTTTTTTNATTSKPSKPSSSFHTFTKITVAIVNLGPIAFVITIMRLIQGASDPPELNEFLPQSLGTTITQGDIRFCAAMGCLILTSVCASLIGGLTVLGLHLCAILGHQPHSRHEAYHLIRLYYYCGLVILGGMAQWLLGMYLAIRFGCGPYEEAVHVAAFTIHFPIISILVGMLQTGMGVYGIVRMRRSRRKRQREQEQQELLQSNHDGDNAIVVVVVTDTDNKGDADVDNHYKNDNSFLYVVAATWLLSTVLQFVLQPAYSDNYRYDAEAATVSNVYLGFFVMPALLDYLVRTTPTLPNPEYYGLPKDAYYYEEDFLTKWFGMEPNNKQNHHKKCKTDLGAAVITEDNQECGKATPERVDDDTTNYATCPRAKKKVSASTMDTSRTSATLSSSFLISNNNDNNVNDNDNYV